MERLRHLIEDAINQGRWKALGLSRRGPKLYHLFFADDLMLFCEADLEQTELVSNILKQFCYFFG